MTAQRRYLRFFLVVGLTVFLASPARAGLDRLQAVRTVIHQWVTDWQHHDLSGYLSHYSPDFRPKSIGREEWLARKKKVFAAKAPIRIHIQGLSVMLSENRAIARFIQIYQGPGLHDTGIKTMEFAERGGRWLITFEEWKPAPALPVAENAPKEPPPAARPRPAAPKPLPAASAPPPPSETGPVQDMPLQSVRFYRTPDAERVCVRLNRFFIPSVFSLDEGQPRLVLDITGQSTWHGPRSLDTNGRWVRQIRTFLHEDQRRLRIVLDLKPGSNLDVDQHFIQKTDTFCVVLSPATSPRKNSSK